MQREKLISLFVILYNVENVFCYDVLLLLGGMYIEQGIRYTHRSVEAIGISHACSRIPPLPIPLHSHFAGRLRDRVFVCGGNDGTYERSECYSFFPSNNTWIRGPVDLEGGENIFAAAAGDNLDNFFVVGGRRFSHQKSDWEYFYNTRVFNRRQNRWFDLPDLPIPIADGCLLTLNGALFLIGGSKARYRYANDPSKVWVLPKNGDRWRDDIFPPLLGQRMWMGCTVANINNEISILVSGGYYNGRTSMTLPLTNFLLGQNSSQSVRWDYVGSLPDERQWGPALGLVAGIPTIATGQNYGDATIEELDESDYWRRIRPTERILRHKREFSAHVSVPHHWFPDCRF